MRSNLQENFYKRLKQLGGVSSSNNPSASLSNSTLIEYSRANDGVALGIVKENHNYFIKTSNSKGEKLGAEDFAYIGGVENKYKYQYHSLSEAEKNRNFYIKTLNESSTKKFKTIAVNEGEKVANAANAQSKADKIKAGEKLKDTAPEKEIAEVPAAAAIVVKKEAGKVKVVDATKESNKKPIVVVKQAKVVKEGFEPNQEEVPAEEPAAEMPAMGGEEGGTVEPELDAAAAALDDMGAGAEPAMGAEPEMGAEPAMGGDGVKDIEKLTGKVTQKIRSTELTPEMTKGFLKSYIASFEKKLSELDHEDRKELANSILKDKEESEMGGDMPAMGGEEGAVAPEASATGGDEESEIEEAINQHLAEMGISGDEEEPTQMGVNTFESYMSERGYNPEKVEEISLMEMVGLMNGYTNECGDSADAEGMSNFVTPEVSDKMNESGNSLFEDIMKPFGEKIKKNKKAYAAESVIPMNEMFGDDEEVGEEEEESDETSPESSLSVGDEPAGEDATEPEAGEENAIELELGGGEEEPIEIKKDISIAPASDAMAIGSPMGSSNGGEHKTATVDLKNATVTLTMNEAEVKLRKIVQKKINEALAGKKPTINEGKKSALSIMIDELVNEAIVKRRAAIEKRLLRK